VGHRSISEVVILALTFIGLLPKIRAECADSYEAR